VHTSSEDKSDDVKDSFYEGLGHVFDQHPWYNIKILLSDFNAKVGREDIFKLTVGNKILQKISSANGVRIVIFAASGNVVVRRTMLPQCDIHKYTWTASEAKMHSQVDHIMRGDDIQVHFIADLSEGLLVILTTVR
jgi:hypothetical protein